MRSSRQERWLKKGLISCLFLLVAITGFGATTTKEYLLGAGDAVRITVYNNADLTTETRIAEDGSIPFPLLGRVTLADISKPAAEEKLSKLLVDGGYLRQATVNLTVTDYRSQQVSVLGEVAKPGKYPITAATTVMDALAQAGGISEKGSSSVRLVQHDATGGTRQREIALDQLVAAQGSADLMVQNGDVIFVSTQPLFYIYGEVQKPGAYPLQRDMTVRQAIATGGGLTLRGTERGLKVSRKGKSGGIEVHKIKLNEPLLAGDVLEIKESMF